MEKGRELVPTLPSISCPTISLSAHTGSSLLAGQPNRIFQAENPQGREESRAEQREHPHPHDGGTIEARGAAIPSPAAQEQPPLHQKDFWSPSYPPPASGSGNLCSIASLRENLPAAINSDTAPPGLRQLQLRNSPLQAFPRDAEHVSNEIQGICRPTSSSSSWKQKGASSWLSQGSKHLQPLEVTALQAT